MHVTISNGIVLAIEFSYVTRLWRDDYTPVFIPGLHYSCNNVQVKTTCEISVISDGEYIEFVSGTSKLHPNDTFKKSIGRRTALGAALRASPEIINKQQAEPLSRRDRMLIWEAYFKAHKETDIVKPDFTKVVSKPAIAVKELAAVS